AAGVGGGDPPRGGVGLGGGRGGGGRGGDEERVRDEVHPARVHLLGEGVLEVTGAQARLDVADAHAAVEGGEGRAHGGRRVPLHEQPVGPLLLEHRVERREGARRERVHRLVGGHQVEVDVGRQGEQAERLIEHVAGLRGRGEGRT